MSVVKSLTTNGMYGAAMQPQKGYKIMEEWKNWLYANGGELFDDAGNVIINNQAAIDALNQYIETHSQAAPPNSANWGFGHGELLQTQTIKMMLGRLFHGFLVQRLQNKELLWVAHQSATA